MGDVVLATALIRQIRHKYPNARLDFITSKQFIEIIQFNPYLDNIYKYDKSGTLNDVIELKNSIKNTLDDNNYDYIVDLQRNLRSKIFRSGLGKRYLFVSKRRLHKLSLVYLKRSLMKEIIPIPEIYRAAARELKIEDDQKGLEVWLENEKISNEYLVSKPDQEVKSDKIRISIAPGAFHYTKQWPKEKFLKLIELIHKNYNAEITIIGGPKDVEITDYIMHSTPVNLIDKTNSVSILETCKVIDNSDLLITNDTGVQHLAAARKIPVISIFGSTVKELGFIPYRTKYVIAEVDLECRPCTHFGLDKCPKSHLNCLNLISEEYILSKVASILDLQA